MTMVDLKRSGNEAAKDVDVARQNENEYFYGLRFSLEGPEMEKLGLTDPEVGSMVNIEGVAKVESYSDGEEGKRVVLFVQKLDVSSDKDMPDRSEIMYKG